MVTNSTLAKSDFAMYDLGPLAWVLDELRKTLSSATKAIKRFAWDAEAARGSDLAAIDASQLRIARQQLHQAVGALEMVGLAGPVLMLRAMETAVQKFVQQPEHCSQDAVAKIEYASFALTEYLEGVLAEKPVSAVSLFPQYRDVLELVRADRIHPADLWSLEWRWIEPQLTLMAQPRQYGSDARSILDQAVLQIMKGKAPEAARSLENLSLGFAAQQTERRLKIFWIIAAGYFEAVAHDLLGSDLYVRRVASRILMQYASLAKGDTTVSERLAHDLLFFCAQATSSPVSDTPVLSAVRLAYGLTRFKPVNYEMVQFGRFDPALLAQARKRIVSAKEAWSSLCAGDVSKVKTVADQFSLVTDSLMKLHPPSEPFAQVLTRAIDATVRSAQTPGIELAMEVATSVLYLEAVFEDLDPNDPQLVVRTASLAQRLEKVRAGGEPQPLESWMEELYSRVSDKQTMGSVVGELRVSLGELEKSLDAFFRNPKDKDILRTVPGQLSQMRGVLSVLGLDQACKAVLRMKNSVQQMLDTEIDEQLARASGTFDHLGNNLGALSFMIDMLNYQPALAKKLFVYDEEKGELKPVMGRAPSVVEVAEIVTVSSEPLPSKVVAVAVPAEVAAPLVSASQHGEPDLVMELASGVPDFAETESNESLLEVAAVAAPAEDATPLVPVSQHGEFDFAMELATVADFVETESSEPLPEVVAVAAPPEDAAPLVPAKAHGEFDLAMELAPVADFVETESSEPLPEVVAVAAPAEEAAPLIPAKAHGEFDLAIELAPVADFVETESSEPQPEVVAVAAPVEEAAPLVPAKEHGEFDLAIELAPVADFVETESSEPQPEVVAVAAPAEEAAPLVPAKERGEFDLAIELAPVADFVETESREPLPEVAAVAVLEEEAKTPGDIPEPAFQLEMPSASTNVVEQPAFVEMARDSVIALSDNKVEAAASVLTATPAMTVQAPVAPPVPAAPPPASVDVDDDDDFDLRDIFLEEAREVIGNAKQAIEALAREPADVEHLTVLRRAFHTLKGSARMVELNEFGEAGWALEQMLNSWLADQKPATKEFRILCSEVIAGFEAWIAAIAANQDASWSAIAFRNSAEAMRVEGRYSALNLSGQTSEVSAAPPVIEAVTPETYEQPDVHELPEVLQVEVDAEAQSEPEPSHAAEVVSTMTFDLMPDVEPVKAVEAVEPVKVVEAVEPVKAVEAVEPVKVVEAVEPVKVVEAVEVVQPVPVIEAPVMRAAEQTDTFVSELADLDFDSFFTLAVKEEASPAALAPLVEEQSPSLPSEPVSVETVELSAEDFAQQFQIDAKTFTAAPLAESKLPVMAEEKAEAELLVPELLSTLELEMPALSPLAHDEPVLALNVEALQEAPDSIQSSNNRQEENITVIDGLRIGTPLYNVYLGEADQWSSRLVKEVAEWALENHQRVSSSTVALAHSLAGSSATVGFHALSDIARALEHALQNSRDHRGDGARAYAQVFVDAAEDIRRLLHQFAAGFLMQPAADILERLKSLEFPDSVLPKVGEYDAYSSITESEWVVEDKSEPDAVTLPDVEVVALEVEPAVQPVIEVAPVVAVEPVIEVAPVVAVQPVIEAAPVVAVEPVIEAAPVAAVQPVIEAAPVAAVQPVIEVSPVVAVEPVIEVAPVVAVEPVIEVAPVVAVQPVIEVAPVVAVEPVIEVAPVVAVQPEVEPVQAAPQVPTPAPAERLSPTVESAELTQMAPIRTPSPVPVAVNALDDHPGVDDDIDAIDAIDPDLFPIFEEECTELMPRLSSSLRQWAEQPDNQGARLEVLRVLHTLKGSARLSGALRLGEMAHRIESEIEHVGSDAAQSQEFEPLLNRLDGMQATFDALRQLDAAGNEQPADVVETASQPLIKPEPKIAESRIEQNAPAVFDAVSNVSNVSNIGKSAIPAPQAMVMQTVRQAATASIRVRSQLLDRMVNQAGEVMITRSRLEAEIGQLRDSLNDMSGNLTRLRQQLRDIELQAESQMQSRLALAKEAQAEFDPLEFDRFTRVQELTRMMAESVNDVATVQRTLQRTIEATEDDLIAQARQTRELQRDLLRTRMVEFEGISERLYRVVRQTSKELGKQVRLDLLGGSLEMDRGMLDRMVPAFEHLLRNCVTHGIESPEVRTVAGKEAVGLISIHVRQEGNDVSVDFSDDGAGLNLKRIREIAIQRGLITADQVLDDSAAANLIFLPGFSTATQVTEIAGRGIGMEVVRSEVNALGGRIETTTVAGQGSHFKLVLPLTTAVTQVVMIRADKLSVGVPANVVETVRRISTKELQQAYNTGTLDVSGEAVPFFWTGALLQASHHSSEPQAKTTPVVIFRSAAQRIALHVDEVLGNREVVVKNLGPQLSRLPGMAGMSVLPSGAVVLIYNPVALAAVYGQQARAWSSDQAEPHMLEGAVGGAVRASELMPVAPKIPLILVVDDSITVRRVTQRMLLRDGYRVALAADGLQALERLQEELPAVVLSDIEMPRMDGFDLARNIRGDERLKRLPIIMITSRIAGKHHEHAKELGVDHYLGKPYSEEELMKLVRHYCALEAAAVAA